ncbi:MAG: TIGR02302 family protein [Yoonia sp.]|nr:TIGR02302 family protein [Yoonia sp.]
MVAERAVRCFWPLWTVLFLILAPLMFGWQDLLSLEAFWALAVLAILAVVAAIVWGLRQFHWPAKAEAVARVDAAMPGRPIAAMADAQAVGRDDPASEAVWNAHIAQMKAASRNARPIEPDLRVSDRDPYGLRFIALLFFVAALMFGSLLRVGSVGEVALGGDTLATGPVWEGWVEPPAYTGKPAIYLNDVPEGLLIVPAGSKITLRLYGEVGALTVAETISGRTEDLGAASGAQQTFIATSSGRLAIDGENGAAWDVRIVADRPPAVDLIGAVEADAMGEMSQPFQAIDDYGVESGTAVIALDLAAVDRRYGLAADPDAMAPLVLDLPMPFNGDRADFDAFLVENLSEHPLANLPVILSMSVTDAAGQLGESIPEQMILPGRRFFQPFAKAVIEQRRDLMWAKSNASQVALVLRAISHRPEGLFSNETTYLRMRAIIRRLEGFTDVVLTDDVAAEVVQAMWDLAVQLEDGTLADARARLARAQERLAEAMRDGASDAEIAELMQELRDATNDYMQMLADQMEPNDGTDQADSGEEGQELRYDELQALMDRIQDLMEQGRMAEAAALMEQLNEMMENLRITQGEGGEGGPRTPGQQSMEDLAETLQDQEDLSDDAFRELQDRANQQGQQPQGGEQGGEQGQQPSENGEQSGQDGRQGQGQGVGEDGNSGLQGENGTGGEGQQGALADRQQALRDELQRQRDGLPNLDGEAGDIARQSLDRAGGAMDGAEEALRNGDMAEAIDRQAEAMDALRDGMRSLNQALAQNNSSEPGQGTERGEAQGRTEPSRRDPLGRELGNTGQFGTDESLLQGEDVYRRAEEILDEIRRRSAEQNRPQIERDYLRRLLDQF